MSLMVNVPTFRFEKYSSSYKQFKLGEVTNSVSRPIKMEDEEDYNLVTVKRRNEGIVKRGVFKGKEVKVKSQYKIEAGDFLISKRQIIHGACEIVPRYLEGAIVSNEYHILHGNKDLLLTEYLNLLSKLPKMKNYFALSCVGVDIEKMLFRIEDWKKGMVMIPSMEEQQKIASFFKLLIQKIEKQQEKIGKLEELKKGLMQKIFSQEIRFKDKDGGEFGEWKSMEFGEVVEKLIGGGTPSRKVDEYYYEGKIPWLTVKDLKTSKYVAGASEHITELGFENSSSKIVDPGDLIIPTRMAVGRILIATEKVAINQDLKGCKLKPQYDTEFIYYLYFSKSEEIEKLGSGSTVSGINIDQLIKIKIHVPEYAEQLLVASFLRKLDEKIEKEKEKFRELKMQKKGLMQGMFL